MKEFSKDYPQPSWLATQRAAKHLRAPEEWMTRKSLQNPIRLIDVLAWFAAFVGFLIAGSVFGYLGWLIGRGLGVW